MSAFGEVAGDSQFSLQVRQRTEYPRHIIEFFDRLDVKILSDAERADLLRLGAGLIYADYYYGRGACEPAHAFDVFTSRMSAWWPLAGADLMIRTTRDPLDVLPAVKTAVWSVNPDQRLSGDTFTLEGYMDRLIAQRRFSMALLALLGALGLVIAAAGVYGVMAYAVSQRTQEIGVRMALGARPADVVSMVMRQAALLVGLGLVLGTAGAWYASAGAEAFLFLVASNDVRVFAAAIAVLGMTGLVACVLPARRASKVDPLIALRGA